MERPLTEHIRPDREPLSLKEYERAGGYQAWRQALKSMAPADVTKVISDSGLSGRGGAGFPTGRKWGYIPMGDDAPRPKYMICNADETEPGTFKDKWLLEGHPHEVIEGTILGAYAIQADAAYVFMRWAYRQAAEAMEHAIAEAYDAGYVGEDILGSGYNLELYLHVSAGRYVCGEATALLNAIEGKRAIPRAKPPHAATAGLWSQPTVVNNVETLANVPHIITKGADWFKGLSMSEKDAGTKLIQVSGKVKRPGVWELPMGITAREVIEEYAGGMRDGLSLRGFLPGGASTPFLVTEHLDTKMDYPSIKQAGSRFGTATMIILDDQTCPVAMTHNLVAIFARESCGWCTPCRDGLPWSAKTLLAIHEGRGQIHDMDRLAGDVEFITDDTCFCGLGPGAMEPLAGALKYFDEDFRRHIRERRCPWR